MPSQWYYMRGSNQIGPVPGALLKQLAAAGDLLPTDLLLKVGTGEWRPAGAVKGLFPNRNPGDPDGLGRARTPLKARSKRQADHESGDYELARPYGLDPASSPLSTRAGLTHLDSGSIGQSPSSESRGRLDLPILSRLFTVHPLGFIAWILFVALLLWCLNVAILLKEARPGHDPVSANRLLLVIDVLFSLISIPIWFWARSLEGKRSACPRCNAWFSALLVESDAHVLGSRADTMTYTGQVAIRDRNFQVTGYVDEQRTMPITVKTVLGVRKYRCKACGHRWQSSEVGSVIV